MPARVRAENQPDGLDPHVSECRRTLPNSLSTHEVSPRCAKATTMVLESRHQGIAPLSPGAIEWSPPRVVCTHEFWQPTARETGAQTIKGRSGLLALAVNSASRGTVGAAGLFCSLPGPLVQHPTRPWPGTEAVLEINARNADAPMSREHYLFIEAFGCSPYCAAW